jgi:hypothetical protein
MNYRQTLKKWRMPGSVAYFEIFAEDPAPLARREPGFPIARKP